MMHYSYTSTKYACVLFFFFNDTATTEIYTLSLHDALPICSRRAAPPASKSEKRARSTERPSACSTSSPSTPSWLSSPSVSCADRKSTRLNSSHANISYAVFCLKKKKKNNKITRMKYKIAKH